MKLPPLLATSDPDRPPSTFSNDVNSRMYESDAKLKNGSLTAREHGLCLPASLIADRSHERPAAQRKFVKTVFLLDLIYGQMGRL